MKKVFAILLLIVMIFSITACGLKDDDLWGYWFDENTSITLELNHGKFKFYEDGLNEKASGYYEIKSKDIVFHQNNGKEVAIFEDVSVDGTGLDEILTCNLNGTRISFKATSLSALESIGKLNILK